MKKNEIKVGGLYTAKVNGKHTTVRVDSIRETGGKSGVHYGVTNLATGRTTTFHSAAKFREEVIKLHRATLTADARETKESENSCPFAGIEGTTATATPPSLGVPTIAVEGEDRADPMTTSSMQFGVSNVGGT